MQLCLPEELVERIDSSFKKYSQYQKLTATTKRNRLNDIYFICHFIIDKIANGRDSQSEENTSFRQSANVYSKDMKFYVNKYNEVLEFLEESYIVKSSKSYSTGAWGKKSHSKTYRFTFPMEFSPVLKVELKNPYILNKIHQRLNSAHVPDFLERYKTEILDRVSIDIEEAENYLIDIYKDRDKAYKLIDFYRLYSPVGRIKIGLMHYQWEKGERFYHTLVGLNNKLRQFLKVLKEPRQGWVEVDISSCSAFLFSSYLLKNGHNEKDLVFFHRLTRLGSDNKQSRDFYTQILDYCIYQTTKDEGSFPEELDEYIGNKKKIKKALVAFFNRGAKSNRNPKRNKKEYILYETLRAYFPTVFREIEKINLSSKRGFYDIVTPMESSVMVEYLVPKLLEKNLVGVTRHDGILCLCKDAEEIKKIIEAGFNERLGVLPAISIK